MNNTSLIQTLSEPLPYVTTGYGIGMLVVCIVGLLACFTNVFIIHTENLQDDVPMFRVIKYQVINDILLLFPYLYLSTVVITQSILFERKEHARFFPVFGESVYAATGAFQIWVAILRLCFTVGIKIHPKIFKMGTLFMWITVAFGNLFLRQFVFQPVSYFEPSCACYQVIPGYFHLFWVQGFSVHYLVIEITSSAIPMLCYAYILFSHYVLRRKSSHNVSISKAELNLTVTSALNASFQGANALGWRYIHWIFNYSNQFNCMFGSILCLTLTERINRRLKLILGCGTKVHVVKVSNNRSTKDG